MKRHRLLVLGLVVAGCRTTTISPATSPTSSTVAASASTSPATSVTCSLGAQECDEALRAVEAVLALQAAGMPPVAVQIVEMSQCRTVTGAPKSFDLCAAPNPPGQPGAIGGGDALAAVTYRAGLGKAFLYVWWNTFASGRGAMNAILVTHNP